MIKTDEKSVWKSDSSGDVHDYLCTIRIKRIQVEEYGTYEEELVLGN